MIPPYGGSPPRHSLPGFRRNTHQTGSFYLTLRYPPGTPLLE